MFRPLALEFISALGMPPDEMMALVADLGLSHVGLAAQPITLNAAAYQPWSLLDDPALLARTGAAMAEHGVSLAIGEGFLIRPDVPAQTHGPALDLMAQLGAPRVNAVNLGGADAAGIAAFADFAEQARARRLRVTVEFLPMLTPATFAQAVEFAERAGVEVLVDAMHFFRSGGEVDELAHADCSRIGHVQICNVPMPAINPDYGREAAQDRLPPGEGNLPLERFLAALSQDVMVGLELPMMSRASSTADMRQLLAPGVAACRKLLDGA